MKPNRGMRYLNQPQPIRVTTDPSGAPATITMRGQTHRVARIADTWCLDDEWWRTPIRRTYYDLELQDGRRETVYRDDETGEWRQQRGG